MAYDHLLRAFKLNDTERTVLEMLAVLGPVGAGGLTQAVQNISRPAVYDTLRRLQDLGLVVESQEGGTKRFNMQKPEKVQLLLDEQKQDLQKASRELKEFASKYIQKNWVAPPRLQHYEGRAALQQMMKDLLLYRDITVRAYWPIRDVIRTLTPEFLARFHEERIARNIAISVIWPKDHMPAVRKHSFLRVSQNLKREARIAPKDIGFSLGYAIYGTTVRFISSTRENTGFLIESAELAEMMHTQFLLAWNASKPYRA